MTSKSEIERKIMKYGIEGEIKSRKKIDFAKADLAVHAFIDNQDVAHATVDKSGSYKLEFEYAGPPKRTELRVIPARFSEHSSRIMALRKPIGAGRFVKKKMSPEMYYARADIAVSIAYVIFLERITKTYLMHGTVYAQHEEYLEQIPGVRMDFYEVDAPGLWRPTETEAFIGSSYTANDGSYEFQFDFTYSVSYWWCWALDRKPDIRVRIFQFGEGTWERIHEAETRWDIEEDLHKDYYVPAEDVRGIPASEEKPPTGFRFANIGLMPIDRLAQGYVTADSLDDPRVRGIRHQPLCGTLRVFGLFGEDKNWAKYKVQVANANSSGPTGLFEDIKDALYGQRYDAASGTYAGTLLGPDDNGYYQNVDIEPEGNWMEHGLKFTWKTSNHPDGYYALRVVGSGDGDPDQEFVPIVVRIDNSRPEVSISCVDQEDNCGHVTYPVNNELLLLITAYDPNGHVLWYRIRASRGPDADEVGIDIHARDDDDDDLWYGVSGVEMPLVMSPMPWPKNCSMAHNIRLVVQGSATDCYNTGHGSQRTGDETNLVITK